LNRTEIADLVFARLARESDRLRAEYAASQRDIGYFFVDDVLPYNLVSSIYSKFPPAGNMKLKKSLREYKYIAAQMNQYEPLLEEVIYAFQDDRIVKLVSKICGIPRLYPDENLYAGGISLMGEKQFLNPHLDNSHDKDRDRWRVLNLLYYVTPDWPEHQGGNLELWPHGLKAAPVTIHSKFNRLVVMATHDSSWHSVSPISYGKSPRCCVSNYYFSDTSLREAETFHITAFRGRPEQFVRDLVLRADIGLRSTLRKLFKRGVVENKHVYKRVG